jgi:hypothetical protein
MAVQNHSTNTNPPNTLNTTSNLFLNSDSNTISESIQHRSISLNILKHLIVEMTKSEPNRRIEYPKT